MNAKLTKCQICGSKILSENSYEFEGIIICDDCYLYKHQNVIACNPLVVYSAKCFQNINGIEIIKRLTDLQKTIYLLIKTKGKITLQELCKKLNLSKKEIEIQLAILRHLELTKAKKENNKLLIVPF